MKRLHTLGYTFSERLHTILFYLHNILEHEMTKSLKESTAVVNMGVFVALTGSMRSPDEGTVPHLDNDVCQVNLHYYKIAQAHK